MRSGSTSASRTAPRERRPRVGGLAPFSTLDYPGKIAAVVFVQGCPWRCGYCHNPHLQCASTAGALGWTAVRELLHRRAGLIDAVVFSGGEPTADPALGEAAAEVRGLGFDVGLHTAGIYPRRLKRVLPSIDWVGIDVKAPFGRYDAVTGVARSGAAALASVEAVLEHARAYEFRTTFHPQLLDEDDVLEIADGLARKGARRFALQEFRAQGCGDARLRQGASGAPRPSEGLLAALRAMFTEFTFRSGA